MSLIKLAFFESEIEKEAGSDRNMSGWGDFFRKNTPAQLQEAIGLAKGNLSDAGSHVGGRLNVLGNATGRGIGHVTGIDVAGKAGTGLDKIMTLLSKKKAMYAGGALAAAGAYGAKRMMDKKKK
jgi:hypothetical protein